MKNAQRKSGVLAKTRNKMEQRRHGTGFKISSVGQGES